MAKFKILHPNNFAIDGSLGPANQLNAFMEDLARNSGWMELARVDGFGVTGDVIPVGTAVRLSEVAVNNVPFETDRSDPIGVVSKVTETGRSEFFGLTIDEFQAGHFTFARILLWGRLAIPHSFAHGALVYLDNGGTGGISDTPFQGGEVPIGEWLKTTPFDGVHLNPEIVL